MDEREWHWRRGLMGALLFLAVCVAYMRSSMSPDATWEHHPFSGPLIVLHTAREPVDYVVGIALLAVLGGGLCSPVFRVSFWTLLLAFLSALAWVNVSAAMARIAAC